MFSTFDFAVAGYLALLVTPENFYLIRTIPVFLLDWSCMKYIGWTYRCVHVLLASGVSKPIRKLRRPACAIMMPLSIQNLDARVIEMNTEAGHIDRARYIPLIHSEDMSSTLPCHDAHHLLKPFIACIQ